MSSAGRVCLRNGGLFLGRSADGNRKTSQYTQFCIQLTATQISALDNFSNMRSLLLSTPPSAPLQGRPQNPINGSDSESYAMAKVILACRGEGQWGSREEDNSKIDMFFSSPHPWHKGERLVLLAQIKSGSRYGASLPHGFKLTGAAKGAAIRTNHGLCVVWVDRDANRIFWAYVHPTTTTRPQEYGAYHEVAPPMLYDLARCAGLKRPGATGGRGITVRKRSSDLSARRKRVKAAYRAFAKVFSPALGPIELTRLGWRHMFRKGRREESKASSLDLIPYLKKLLEQCPSTHAITEHKTFVSNGYIHRVCEHLMKFDQVKLETEQSAESKPVIAHIRVVEEVRYPHNWESNVMLSQLVSRRVVLRSAYWKEA